jgi:hypothetical protein
MERSRRRRFKLTFERAGEGPISKAPPNNNAAPIALTLTPVWFDAVPGVKFVHSV